MKRLVVILLAGAALGSVGSGAHAARPCWEIHTPFWTQYICALPVSSDVSLPGPIG